jgi:ribosomal protein S18 acetylase RimI-like enzyme
MLYPIRRLTADDYDELIALWQRSGLGYRPRGRDSREAVAKEIQRSETAFFGMFDGDKMIGSIIGSSDGRRGWINRLTVDPDYRGRGLAALLLKECEDFLHQLGLKVIAALIEGGNQGSFSTFKKSGYIYSPDVVYYSKRFTQDD